MTLRRSASIASVFAVLASSSPGLARPPEQPRAAVTAAMTEESRKLYLNGVQAASESRWEAAHAMFLAARALHPHYTIDGNLAACELQMGRYRDAAEHLARYLRELKMDATSTAEERAQAEAGYAKARAKVGAVILQANVERAAVLVDGVQMGTTPMVDPLFVEPGKHTVTLERVGYVTEERTVDVGAGGEIASTVTLRKPAESGGAAAPLAAREAGPTKLPDPSMVPPERRSWVPAIALGAASVVGLGVGVGMTVASNDASADVDRQTKEIHGAGGQCAKPIDAFAARCAELHRTGTRADAFGNAARVAYIAGGALAIATVGYALWPSREPSRPAGVRARLEVLSDGMGVGVVGVW
ncbi:PEGA domain-containing protein [Sorangium sp. So ce448]|uniref:PEGA domain-containing protein n=1 Tax=Sorangium sp. So ce448 TaxID=3133314 RepID=UPI003F5F7A2F